MAAWEWIPFVSTIGHALQTPKGASVADYSACTVTAAACEADSFTAELLCERCVDLAMSQYISSYTGVGTGADFMEALLGGGFSAVMALIAKALGKKVLGLSATAWTGVGAAFALDGIADAAIQLSKLNDIREAAVAAKEQNCRCPRDA